MSDADGFALFLDFDGTLVEIAPRPDAIRVDPALVRTLERLRDRLGGALAIVTGRPIVTIDDFLKPARLDVAGVHGAERRVGGQTQGGAEDRPELRAGIARVTRQVAPLDGVLVEDKGVSVGIHWRLAAPEAAREAEAIVTALAQELGESYRLQLGKAVGEVLPASATKGHAIRGLMERPPYAGRRAIFFGDDRTDELAFATVNEDGGISVRIGEEETIAARRLASPEDVRALLASWADGGAIDPDALPPA